MQFTTQIPQDLKMKVDRELEPGERISWIDMPNPTFFTPRSKTLFIFAIIWTLFTVFWIRTAAELLAPNFKEVSGLVPLIGLPFLLIGIGILLTPLFARYKTLKTVYVITNRRALIYEGGWSETVLSYPPAKLLNIHRKEKRDGTGDVIISFDEWQNFDGNSNTELLGFFRIRDPKTVELMLQNLARQADAEAYINTHAVSRTQAPKGSFGSKETIINQGNLSRSKSKLFIGKLIVILAFSCYLGYDYHSDSLENYEKGQSLTLNEYIEEFDAHKAELLNPGFPLWSVILFISFIAAAFFGAYELLGKGFGWVLWKVFQSKEEVYSDRPQIA